jgi:hypothetical protein
MRNIRYLIVIVPIILIILTIPARAQDTMPTLGVSPAAFDVSEAQIGGIIQLNITVANVTNLWGWKVRVNWNPQVLNLSQIQEGSFLKNAGSTLFVWPGLSSPTINEGYMPEVTCGLFTATGTNGSGILATFSFKVLTSGVSAVSMNETQLLEPGSPHQEISHTVVDGEVTVIPEFNIATIVPLFMIVSAFLIVISRKIKWNSMKIAV